MRILVVEDETKMAGLLARGLTKRATRSTSPRMAPTACGQGTENEYDVIVLDLMLPDMTASTSVAAARRAAAGRPS